MCADLSISARAITGTLRGTLARHSSMQRVFLPRQFEAKGTSQGTLQIISQCRKLFMICIMKNTPFCIRQNSGGENTIDELEAESLQTYLL